SLRVTPHTIRAWERRYALPLPARDRGGQRRYTAEDVELLLRISHAVTVRGHSLKLASLEAQGLLTDEVADFGNLPAAAAVSSPAGPISLASSAARSRKSRSTSGMRAHSVGVRRAEGHPRGLRSWPLAPFRRGGSKAVS